MGIFLFLALIAVFLINNYIESTLEDEIQKEFSASQLSYEDISFNVLTGNGKISGIAYSEDNLKMKASSVALKNLNYSTYLSSGKIVLDHVIISNPEITIIESDQTKEEDVQEGEMEENYRVKNLVIDKGILNVTAHDTASNSLFVSIHKMTMNEVLYNKDTYRKSIPVEFNYAEIESDSLYYKMGEEHEFTIRHINLENQNLSLKEIRISPKRSREEFVRRSSYSTDYMQIGLEEVNMDNFEWESRRDTLVFKSTATGIEGLDVHIYRNTMLPEDTRYKPLYSELFRELGVKLKLDSINIKNSQIVYEEQVLDDRSPGKIEFLNVEASVKNLTNINMNAADFPKTRVNAKALFMGRAPLSLDWTFDISNELDEFTATGSLGSILASEINPMLIPAMSVEAEGEINSLYYNFYGNNHQARGDMKMEYRDFKVNILKDGEQERKTILSWLANLFISDDAVNEDVTQENIEVERIKHKSFWNYLWLCVRDGAFGTFL